MVWNEELQRDIPEGWGSAKLKDVIVENPKSKIKVGDVKKHWVSSIFHERCRNFIDQ